MGKKAKKSRGTLREHPSPRAPTERKGKSRKTKARTARPHSILLADLFLWIGVVDECLYHPVGAFERAAKTEGYGSVGNVTQRLDVLENEFGMLLYRNLSSGYRSGVPTFRGAGDHGFKLATVGSAQLDIRSLVHPPDSHTRVLQGIPKRIEVSDLDH